jgi:glycine oxidase
MQRADAVIAGAGIIGLSAAVELASAGLRVVVLERGNAMRECSWAAAGMLAANDPENLDALRPLSKLSIGLYPEFLAGIARLAGHTIAIRTTQTLQGAHTLRSGIEQLSSEAIQAIAPGLQADGLRFFLLEEQSLDPRDLARALPAAAKALGVTLIEQTEVTGIKPQHEAVRVETTAGEWHGTHFINACGAWAAGLAAVPAAVPIVPRKGQMLVVQCRERLDVAIRTPELYLLPRADGRIVIGATVEDAGYGKQVDRAAIESLHRAAANLWPPVGGAKVLDSWAGLRPATPDALPVIGPSTEADSTGGAIANHWLATGHFRNGILLAPGTARLLRQMILREPLSIDVSAFSACRFTESFAR